MLVNGIHHISMTCTTPEKYVQTIDFYHRVLGMSVWKQWGTGVMMKCQDDVIEVFLKPEEKDLEQGTIRHFAFFVDDVDACIKAVREEGYPILVEPKDASIPTEHPYEIRVGFCKGPLGEEIEFFQER